MVGFGTSRRQNDVNRVNEKLPQPPPENDVYLYLKDVKEKVFSKYDWIFLNDRIIFVRTEGIGTFVAKKVRTSYSEILGEDKGNALIKKLRELRGKKVSTISDQNIVDILSVDQKNMQILYSDMDQVRLDRRLFRGYRLVIASRSVKRVADIAWNRVSQKRLVLFFKARVGSRFFDR
jgi:hypothetical protein